MVKASKAKRGERRYVYVKAADGEVFRVLTSLLNPAVAIIEHWGSHPGSGFVAPSDAFKKASVFETTAEVAKYRQGIDRMQRGMVKRGVAFQDAEIVPAPAPATVEG